MWKEQVFISGQPFVENMQLLIWLWLQFFYSTYVESKNTKQVPFSTKRTLILRSKKQNDVSKMREVKTSMKVDSHFENVSILFYLNCTQGDLQLCTWVWEKWLNEGCSIPLLYRSGRKWFLMPCSCEVLHGNLPSCCKVSSVDVESSLICAAQGAVSVHRNRRYNSISYFVGDTSERGDSPRVVGPIQAPIDLIFQMEAASLEWSNDEQPAVAIVGNFSIRRSNPCQIFRIFPAKNSKR